MARLVGTPLHHLRGHRLLALLLALLLSVTAFSAHATMDACLNDCLPGTVELQEMDELGCPACAAHDRAPALHVPLTDALAQTAPMAIVVHTPLPPRRPPRA